MSIRNWLFIAAIGIAFVAGASLAAMAVVAMQRSALENIQSYRDEQSRAAANQKQAAEQIARECAIPGAPVDLVGECLAGQISARQRDHSTSVDAEAQQDMAYWAKIMAYISAATVPISLAGLGALLMSLRQTRKAISISQEVDHAQVRAYLAVEVLPLVLKSGESLSSQGIKIHNAGQSPAVSASVFSEIFIAPFPYRDNDTPRRDAPRYIKTPSFITPGGAMRGQANRFGDAITWNFYRQAIQANSGHAVYVYLYATYRDVFGNDRFIEHLAFVDSGTLRVKTLGDHSEDRHEGWVLAHCYNRQN